MNALVGMFEWLLTASLRASAVACVVVALQWLLRRHLSARWNHALWLPVLLVLLAPAFPESRWGLRLPFWQEPLTGGATPPQAWGQGGEKAPQMLPEMPLEAPQNSAPTPMRAGEVAALVWLTGAVGLLTLGGYAFSRTLRRIHSTGQPPQAELRRLIEQTAEQVGLQQLPVVWQAGGVSSPAVTGVFRPTLLLPLSFEKDFTAAEMRHILRHELVHLKRCDLATNALLCLLLCLHWFNPLLWLAFFRVRADRELACDAQVLAGAAPQTRLDYGHTLLKAESTCSAWSLGFVGLFQRGEVLRTRIGAVANPREVTRCGQAVALVGTLVVTFLGLTQAAPPEKEALPTTSTVQRGRVPTLDLAQGAGASAGDGSDFLVKKLDQIILPKVEFNAVSLDEAVTFLKEQARVHDHTTTHEKLKGMPMILRKEATAPPTITLSLRNVPLKEALDYVTKLAGYNYRVAPYAVVLQANSRAAGTTTPGSPSTGTSAQTLGAHIILPKVQLRAATLNETLEFIRLKARELDPTKKGINIVLKPGNVEPPTITLDLINVPLPELLRYVSVLSKHQLAVVGQTYVLTPVGR